jgi:hypothetical protein
VTYETNAILVLILISATGAGATSVKDYDAKPVADKSELVANVIDKMTTDLWAKNPDMARDIRNLFGNRPGTVSQSARSRPPAHRAAFDLPLSARLRRA